MALSPWHLARTFKDHEAGALLAGYTDINIRAESWLEVDTGLVGQWVERMIEAAHRRELTLLDIQVSTSDPHSLDFSKLKGAPLDRPIRMEEMVREKLHCVSFEVERGELYRWLRASGIEYDAIPEALRVVPEPQASTAQLPNQSAEGEELRALEALGLLTETFAKKGPSNCRNLETGKPNCAQIAKAMKQQAGEIYGMGESKLARLLSNALDAWEEKRR